ncbi:uncharacterized protein [Nicotiana tomentosiformis]|uniref:uncharacterized protein n=1 Tax=Nicotiana tomentosiformis TaxID=4098 RepID=UPI00388C6B44
MRHFLRLYGRGQQRGQTTIPMSIPTPFAHPARGRAHLVRGGDASVLFNLGSTYSDVSSYFASHLSMPRDSLDIHVFVSIPVGDSIVVYRVYRSSVVTINGYDTIVDRLLLDLVDFDVIINMNWLSLYHSILDCHAKTVTLAMSGLPRLEWRRTIVHSTSRVISFLKAQRMVKKGCLEYLAHIKDSSAEVPSMDSMPVVREFPEVFPANLPGILLDRDIEFCIDLVSGTQPISILPYCMAPIVEGIEGAVVGFS